MSTRRVDDGIVLDCNVAGCFDSLENGDATAVYDTGSEAVDAGIEAGWTRLDQGHHACNRGNQAHHEARLAARATTT